MKDRQFFEYVRIHDYDSFICTLLAPRAFWEDLCVIYAFNIELMSTVYKAVDSMVLLIQLRWWRDKIDEIYEGKEHKSIPLINSLGAIVCRYDVPKQLLQRYFDGCERIILTEKYDDISDLELLAEQTTVSIMKILLIIMSNSSPNGFEVSEKFLYHSGVGWNLMNNLRNEFCARGRNASFLPQSLVFEAGLNSNNISNQDAETMLREVVKIIVQRIESHVDQASFEAAKLEKDSQSMVTRNILTEIYLEKIKSRKFNLHKIGGMLLSMKIKLLTRYFIKYKFKTIIM